MRLIVLLRIIENILQQLCPGAYSELIASSLFTALECFKLYIKMTTLPLMLVGFSPLHWAFMMLDLVHIHEGKEAPTEASSELWQQDNTKPMTYRNNTNPW